MQKCKLDQLKRRRNSAYLHLYRVLAYLGFIEKDYYTEGIDCVYTDIKNAIKHTKLALEVLEKALAVLDKSVEMDAKK